MKPAARGLVALLGCTVVLTGCSAPEPNDSERYRDRVTVEGFRVVDSDYYQRTATAAYVGAVDVDVAAAVSGPGLTVVKGGRDLSSGALTYLADGFGSAADTGRCWVSVYRHKPGRAAVDNLGSDRIDARERAGIVDGSVARVDVRVVCDAQADG